MAALVQRRFTGRFQRQDALQGLRRIFPDGLERDAIEKEALAGSRYFDTMDVAALLKIMSNRWHQAFVRTFDTVAPAQETLVSNLRKRRNDWAHQRNFSAGEAYAALDSMRRLLSDIESTQSGAVERLTAEHLKVYPNAQSANYRRAA